MYVLSFLFSVTGIFVVVLLMRNRKRAFVSSELTVSGQGPKDEPKLKK